MTSLIALVALLFLVVSLFFIRKNSKSKTKKTFSIDRLTMISVFQLLAMQTLIVLVSRYFLGAIFYFWFYDFKSEDEQLFLLVFHFFFSIIVFAVALLMNLFIIYKKLQRKDILKFAGLFTLIIFEFLLIESFMSRDIISIVKLIAYPLLSFGIIYYFLRNKLK